MGFTVLMKQNVVVAALLGSDFLLPMCSQRGGRNLGVGEGGILSNERHIGGRNIEKGRGRRQLQPQQPPISRGYDRDKGDPSPTLTGPREMSGSTFMCKLYQ